MGDGISMEKVAAALENLLDAHNRMEEKVDASQEKINEMKTEIALVKQSQETQARDLPELRKVIDALRDRTLTADTEKRTERKTISGLWVTALGAVGALGGLVVWAIQRLFGNGHGPVGK